MKQPKISQRSVILFAGHPLDSFGSLAQGQRRWHQVELEERAEYLDFLSPQLSHWCCRQSSQAEGSGWG